MPSKRSAWLMARPSCSNRSELPWNPVTTTSTWRPKEVTMVSLRSSPGRVEPVWMGGFRRWWRRGRGRRGHRCRHGTSAGGLGLGRGEGNGCGNGYPGFCSSLCSYRSTLRNDRGALRNDRRRDVGGWVCSKNPHAAESSNSTTGASVFRRNPAPFIQSPAWAGLRRPSPPSVGRRFRGVVVRWS